MYGILTLKCVLEICISECLAKNCYFHLILPVVFSEQDFCAVK